MPDCYFLAISEGAALDKTTNNWSLFNLIEQIRIAEIPVGVPFQVHTYWNQDPGDYGQKFDVRVVLVRMQEDQPKAAPVDEEHVILEYTFTASTAERNRLRVVGGFEVPCLGDMIVKIDWRRHDSGDPWTRCDPRSHFKVELTAKSNDTPSS